MKACFPAVSASIVMLVGLLLQATSMYAPSQSPASAPGSFGKTRAPGLWINREAGLCKPMELKAAS
ncbi:MAG: hypothetical protein ACAH88_06865, partial [Roseimicrobium sp.]